MHGSPWTPLVPPSTVPHTDLTSSFSFFTTSPQMAQSQCFREESSILASGQAVFSKTELGEAYSWMSDQMDITSEKYCFLRTMLCGFSGMLQRKGVEQSSIRPKMKKKKVCCLEAVSFSLYHQITTKAQDSISQFSHLQLADRIITRNLETIVE